MMIFIIICIYIYIYIYIYKVKFEAKYRLLSIFENIEGNFASSRQLDQILRIEQINDKPIIHIDR